MERYVIKGGTALQGEVEISGAKNAALGLIAAAIMADENVTIDINHKLVLDLINVPTHIDTATLSKMLQDKKVLRELTNNLDFQSFDSEVKQKLLNKSIRAKGR